MTITVCIFDAYGTLFDVAAAARQVATEKGREELAAIERFAAPLPAIGTGLDDGDLAQLHAFECGKTRPAARALATTAEISEVSTWFPFRSNQTWTKRGAIV